MALPPGAMGLSAVCDCDIFLIILAYFFKLSSHKLHIERGRYENVPRDERFCKFCNMSQIESEYHFLLVCPL